jgi:hypothetical protein
MGKTKAKAKAKQLEQPDDFLAALTEPDDFLDDIEAPPPLPRRRQRRKPRFATFDVLDVDVGKVDEEWWAKQLAEPLFDLPEPLPPFDWDAALAEMAAADAAFEAELARGAFDPFEFELLDFDAPLPPRRRRLRSLGPESDGKGDRLASGPRRGPGSARRAVGWPVRLRQDYMSASGHRRGFL